jgi:hypothetical protein
MIEDPDLEPEPDPDPYLWLMDPDSEARMDGSYGSGAGFEPNPQHCFWHVGIPYTIGKLCFQALQFAFRDYNL